MDIYLVGGSVRDELLGLPIQDQDWVVVGATPAQMLAQGYQQVGKDFPVFLHPKTKEEYALARTERKLGLGYYNFSCDYAPNVTLEEDLLRRDLTINAIAKSAVGTIIDPYNGVQDLQAKILRHVSMAFAEDPVRILRVARFAARFAYLGFTIADETMQLMQQMVQAGEVTALVPERVWQEMHRALQEQNPEIFFIVLHQCGALAQIFPALDKLWGIPQPIKHHPEVDTGVHVMLALQQSVLMGASARVRFAVLCHDLGKGTTLQQEWPSHRGHEERGVTLIQDWCSKYRIPHEYSDLAIKVSRWHLHAHRATELRAETIVKLFLGLDAFRKQENLEDYLLACAADAKGRLGRENDLYPNAAIIKQAYLAATNVDVSELLEKGLIGKQLGDAILRARIKAVQQTLNRN